MGMPWYWQSQGIPKNENSAQRQKYLLKSNVLPYKGGRALWNEKCLRSFYSSSYWLCSSQIHDTMYPWILFRISVYHWVFVVYNAWDLSWHYLHHNKNSTIQCQPLQRAYGQSTIYLSLPWKYQTLIYGLWWLKGWRFTGIHGFWLGHWSY